jgi:hypothetical protein
MSEYRITGKVKDTRVMTEWMDEPRGVVEGVMLGLDMRGWEETGVEER